MSFECFAQDNVEAITRQYFNTLETEGFVSIGRYMHPEALSDFKEMVLPVFISEAESGQRQLLDITFGAPAEVDDLSALAPEEFMNGFMNLVAAQAGSALVSFDKLDILGTVSEGDDIHVLTRTTVLAGELEITGFEVLSFRPYEGSWGLLLNGEMKGIAAALRANL